MAQKSPRPAQAPWITPYMTLQHPEKTAEFYQKAFKFEVKELAPGEDGSIWHVEMMYQGQLLMMGKQGTWGCTTKTPASSGVESPINLYVYVDNVDDFYHHAIKQGAKSLTEPEDMFWGDRMCTLQDPEGYNWCFATHLGNI